MPAKLNPGAIKQNMSEKLTKILESKNLERFGFTELTRPLTMDFYLDWIKSSQYGEMEYLKNHVPKKENPQALLPKARSAIVLSFSYLPHPYPERERQLKGARTALYSRGKDYHHWIGLTLNELCEELKIQFPEESFVGFVDSGPVLERDLAQRAGLGWYGKNTCIIHPKRGSLFFIAEIYTTLKLDPNKQIQSDHCGTCRRCIDICPTGALNVRNLDARKCISYLTIESKEIPSPSLRSQIGDWLFGCDLCQSVCPWNIKFYKNEIEIENQDSKKEDLITDLSFILESSNKALAKNFRDSSLSRASGNKLKRNAIIVAANRELIELSSLISSYKSNPYFSELCDWALQKLARS